MDLHIDFIRHAKTEPFPIDDHRKRRVSGEGRVQAFHKRRCLGYPRYDVVMCSELIRTQETGRIVASLGENAQVVVIPELYGSEEDARVQAINRAFEKLGHSSLRAYHTFEIGMQETFGSLANDAYWAIMTYLMKVREEKPLRCLIVGHALHIPAIVALFCQETVPDEIMDTVVGECDGYKIVIANDQACVTPFMYEH